MISERIIVFVVRTADKTRKAEVSLDGTYTGKDVIQSSVSNWNLPAGSDYSLVNVSSGKTISQNSTLIESGITDGDLLEIQPVLVAGI